MLRPEPPYPDPIPGLIPFGSLNIFSGASGSGKTRIKAAWCKAWLTGQPILDLPTNKPTGLYYLAVDRPWHPTYTAAFGAAGVDGDLHRYALCDDLGSGYDARMHIRKEFSALAFLETCLDRLNPAPGGLVFIDPLAPLFVYGNQNDARSVAVTLHWIRQCMLPRQITVICDANVTKMRLDEDFKRPQDRISGSGAFLAYADTIFNFSEGLKPSDPRTLTWMPRTGEPGEALFEFDKVTQLFVPYTGLRDEGDTPENDRPTQLLALLPGDGADREDWYQLAQEKLPVKSYSLATFKRDIDVLIRRKLIVRDSYGHYTRTRLA